MNESRPERHAAPASSDSGEDLDTSSAPQSSANPFNVTVSIPEVLEIRMVDASVLADYEVWFFISSLLSSAVVGFLVAFFQSYPEPGETGRPSASLLATTLMFAVLLVISVAMTLMKRRQMRKRSKPLRLGSAE